MTKHTAGPWVGRQDDLGHDWNRYICRENPAYDSKSRKLGHAEQLICIIAETSARHANARLIAAAPDLLELAEALVGTMPGKDFKQWVTPDILADMARAAIAKARNQ